MLWYFYIIYFFAGGFLANGVPHFVNGISGRKFPTPFAHPPGIGLSSPTVNVLWGFTKFVVGSLLLTVIGSFLLGLTFETLVAILGALAISLFSSRVFGKLK